MGAEKNAGEDSINSIGGLKTREEIRMWVEEKLGLKLPQTGVCKHHQSPLDYLAAAHIEPTRDVVSVGAARRRQDAAGGGGDAAGSSF